MATVPPVVVQTKILTPDIPGDLLTCDVPAPADIAMDSDVADYIALLHAAAALCARKVAALRAIVTTP